MRFLVDANLSPRVAAALNAAGHDAVHVAELGLGNNLDAITDELDAGAVVSISTARIRVRRLPIVGGS